jgi:predicted enzyme related to lactoylglutathione lyase
VAFLRSTTGDPPERPAGIGDWLWTELWTSDIADAGRFYGDLIGYELDQEVILDDIEYTIFTRGEVPRAGLVTAPIDEVRANWLPYVRVEDSAGLAARTDDLGGKVLLAPDPDLRDGTVAVVIDPSGAALALQEWSGS